MSGGAIVRGSATYSRRYSRREQRGPTPAEQLRLGLAESRREGLCFEAAWPAALAAIEWTCPEVERDAWHAALSASLVIDAFAAGYARREMRAAAVVARLRDARVWEADAPVTPSAADEHRPAHAGYVA
jgi:hypothetical protein